MTPAQKPLSDYTDREVIELATRKASEAVANTKWIKNYIIVTSLLIFAYWILKGILMILPLM